MAPISALYVDEAEWEATDGAVDGAADDDDEDGAGSGHEGRQGDSGGTGGGYSGGDRIHCRPLAPLCHRGFRRDDTGGREVPWWSFRTVEGGDYFDEEGDERAFI